MFSGSQFTDFVGIVIILCFWEPKYSCLGTEGGLSLAEHNYTRQLGLPSSAWVTGNPKTLTPSPRTPTTDRVRGLLTDRSTDYPYGPLNGPPPK